eukprot:6184257-Pleurochrysis_carterae.AAC.1
MGSPSLSRQLRPDAVLMPAPRIQQPETTPPSELESAWTKLGAVAVPVFSSRVSLPLLWPKSKSTRPSPSQSPSAGALLPETPPPMLAVATCAGQTHRSVEKRAQKREDATSSGKAGTYRVRDARCDRIHPPLARQTFDWQQIGQLAVRVADDQIQGVSAAQICRSRS